MNHKKVIKDNELAGLMKQIRMIVGAGVVISFKTTASASKLLATYSPGVAAEGIDVKAPTISFQKQTKKDLEYVG